jgi:hypothetical protein
VPLQIMSRTLKVVADLSKERRCAQQEASEKRVLKYERLEKTRAFSQNIIDLKRQHEEQVEKLTRVWQELYDARRQLPCQVKRILNGAGITPLLKE